MYNYIDLPTGKLDQMNNVQPTTISSYYSLWKKDKYFWFFTLIKKTYHILVTNALFSVINYFLQFLANKILINTIMFLEVNKICTPSVSV